MKVFFDVFSNDEMISDSYKIEKIFDGVGGEVKSRYVIKGAENIDIGKHRKLTS